MSGIIIWIFPMFDAQPLLGPIYRPIDFLVAPPFPVLIIFPAIAFDFITHKKKLNDWVLSIVLGIIFIIILFPIQYYFAEFLLSDAGQNRFFGQPFNKPYWAPIGKLDVEFWPYDMTPSGRKIPLTVITPMGLLISSIFAIISTRVGIWWGNWLKKVKR